MRYSNPLRTPKRVFLKANSLLSDYLPREASKFGIFHLPGFLEKTNIGPGTSGEEELLQLAELFRGRPHQGRHPLLARATGPPEGGEAGVTATPAA